MKDITVPILLSYYLVQWLTHALGNPVKFPVQSYENRLLSRLLSRRPRGEGSRATSPVAESDAGANRKRVSLVIPDNDLHRPEYFNHLSVRASAQMAEAIDTLFRLRLWSECVCLIHSQQGLNQGLDQWCRRQGISIEYREAVRQKFYRMRRAYERDGIILGEKHRRRYHASVKK